jgi:7-cyano-7-deazaguanine synthase
LLVSGDAIPEGHYQEESMRQTVVPGRNLLFISVLAAIAQSKGMERVWLGIHAGDHFIYPDCRRVFFVGARSAVEESSAGAVSLYAPFLTGNKTNIIKYGTYVGVPYHLTRTCYSDQLIACGRCGSCQERLEAFSQCGIADPLKYQTRELLPKS